MAVYGRLGATAIYQLLGMAAEGPAEPWIARYEAGLAAYRGRRWAEAIADFDIGDLTLRLVAPLDPTSDWHDVVASGWGTLHSVALAVDLDTAPAALTEAGIRVAREDPGALWLDPADTFGLRLQLVDA